MAYMPFSHILPNIFTNSIKVSVDEDNDNEVQDIAYNYPNCTT